MNLCKQITLKSKKNKDNLKLNLISIKRLLKLRRKYPNDSEFGKEVSILINKFKKYDND